MVCGIAQLFKYQSSSMSARSLIRAAKPLGRPAAVARRVAICGPLTTRYYSAPPAIRPSTAGDKTANKDNTGSESSEDLKNASTWPLSSVVAVALGAGLAGWVLSEFQHRGFPGAMMLDSLFPMPKYASIPEMEQVGHMLLSYLP